MKENNLFLLVALAGSLLMSNLYAQETPLTFSHQSIEIKGAVDDVILKDINNDGIQEVLFRQGRNLIIYALQSSPTGVNFIQNSVYRLPDDVCMFDIAKIDSQKHSLIYINSKGISSFPIELEVSGKRRQSITPTLFFTGSSIFRDEVFDTPLHKNLLFNLDKDNRVMVMPGINKFSFVYPGTNDTYQSEEIHLPTISNIYWDNNSIFEPLITEASLPSFVFADLNNDKSNDFIVPKQNKIYGYLLKEPDEKKHEFKDIGCLLETQDCDSLLVKDINNDGCADVLCADNGEGTIYIYLNQYNTLHQPNTGQSNQSRYFSNTPTQIIRTNSWIVKNDLIDLNNDSLEDLVLVQMNKLGVMGGLQAILAQMLEWEIAVYLARPPKDASTLLYPKSPDYIRTIRLPFSLSYAGSLFVGKQSEVKIQIPYLWSSEGDFNGDKIRDLLISGGQDGNLEIYLGDKSQVFNRTLSTPIDLLSADKKLKLTGESYISDINNDGKSDIIIPSEQENPDKSILHSYEILLSH